MPTDRLPPTWFYVLLLPPPQNHYRIINTRRRRFCPELISVINIRIPVSASHSDWRKWEGVGHSPGWLELTSQPTKRSVHCCPPADGSRRGSLLPVFQKFRTQRIFRWFYCWLRCRWMDGWGLRNDEFYYSLLPAAAPDLRIGASTADNAPFVVI